MAYLRIFDRAGIGFDMSTTNNGVENFSPDDGGYEPIGAGQFDHDTIVTKSQNEDLDEFRHLVTFFREEAEGVVIERILYTDENDRPSLDWREAEIFIAYDDLFSDTQDWVFSGFQKRDTIIGNKYRDILKGGDSDDLIEGRGGDDRLFGERDDDDLHGAAGRDSLYGGTGDDMLDGGWGNDRLYGGSGDDALVGGMGRDRMNGGDGGDVFVFDSLDEIGNGARRDTIRDFDRAEDFIDLSGIDANEGRRRDQSFDFIGKDRFSGEAGELRFVNETLMGDVDGDGRTDFKLTVEDVNSLREADFFL